ncbi:YqzG/YhdC family protein [Brevibacillus parabrevis]|uniref:YqzG/YhdC family protein n=1 Tax=Brevibacillus parabrevis TaxID=54914 RepID=UPI0028D156E2|nr:YqzG/YhdC family protein [Brevibacillus parabrevis]MED1722381.1 YqzG/YhdC family protein [Brevibacillus parabrevis]
MHSSVNMFLTRSFLATLAASLLLFFFQYAPANAQPPYAKWGRLAMQETMQKYPHAQIVDYLHVGRIAKTPTTSEETFKLLLQQGNRRWALLVHIEFENQTERVVNITYEETV